MNMRVRTVRQVKQQQRPRNKRVAAVGNEINNVVVRPVGPPPPIPKESSTTPPYRMPPQPQPGGSSIYGEASIPGAAPTEPQNGISNITLRTHSSKFPIERELILSSDKNASKIPLMHESRTPSGLRRATGLQLLPRPHGSIAPDHPPKQMQAWNAQTQCIQQQQQQQEIGGQVSLTGAIPRAPARLPEDVTALAERENGKNLDIKDTNKNAVAKTYHTLKDLISSKFKKENNESIDGLNNVSVQQPIQQIIQTQNIQQQQQQQQMDDYRSPYSALPMHMRQNQSLNQSQPNIWMGNRSQENTSNGVRMPPIGQQRPNYTPEPQQRQVIQQQRAISQPQLNMNFLPQQQQQMQSAIHPQQQQQVQSERRGSLANIDVTDSDDGGFISKSRRPQTLYHLPQQHSHGNLIQQQQSSHQHQNIQQQQLNINNSNINGNQRNSPHVFQGGSSGGGGSNVVTNGGISMNQNYNQQQLHEINNTGNQQLQYNGGGYQTQQQQNQYIQNGAHQQFQQQQQPQQSNYQQFTNQINQQSSSNLFQSQKINADINSSSLIQTRQDQLRASFQKLENPSNLILQSTIQQQQIGSTMHKFGEQETNHQIMKPQPPQRPDAPPRPSSSNDLLKPVPGSAASSDYDKSGNHSSNVDSGRGSAAYSSGRKGVQLDTSPESSDSVLRPTKETDSEWVDIVDAELRHILEPGMQDLSIRPESTVSGSVSSISPPLPPLSPDGSRYKTSQPKEPKTPEYGTDSYNRPGKGPIGPSRAGWPGSAIQKQINGRSISKKQEQSLLKRHLFGLDNDLTSTTTRSLDLESLLGTPWGGGQSVSDSETDTQGLRHIRHQLEGLETMYSEVLRMLGSRNPSSRLPEAHVLNGRRRHGSLSSLPSSSVSGRPIRDRRRAEGRRKVRDIKGINKRFQRLESHVVTLARSVAHLSSEMRSQHLVTQELERLRDEFATLRAQSGGHIPTTYGGNGVLPEPPNLTNPKRVKKLTKFFGEDPPLMRLFLRKLGYEKYAGLFEAERVGMIELPYLGEERLQKLGVPLGPRLRILQEAQISLCKDTTLCIV